MPSTEPHFQFITKDGTPMMHPDGTPYQFRPAAYLALIQDDNFIFVRDKRKYLLQFTGGGVDIVFNKETHATSYEMEPEAAIREAMEEIGVDAGNPRDLITIGKFSMLEPCTLLFAPSWNLPNGGFVLQEKEVSEVVQVPYSDVKDPITRERWRHEFYPSQWTMFGQLLTSLYYDKKLAYIKWRDEAGNNTDTWAQFDSYQR